MIYSLTLRGQIKTGTVERAPVAYWCQCGIRWLWKDIPVQALGILCPQCGAEYKLREN